MRTYFTLMAIVLSYCALAQTVTIKKVELAGDKVLVYFDLDDSNSSHEFALDLFASRDNFTVPLAKVKGDVGQEVKPGVNKKIEWSIIEEYGGYKGKLALEIRGRVYLPFVKLQNFNTEQSYKRGKSYNLLFKVGSTNPIHVELYKGSQRVSGEMNHPNNGSYLLTIPSNATPGSDYRLKITDSKSNTDVVYSPLFKVKPKISTVVKILVPAVIIGGAAAALGGGGKKDTSGGGTGNNTGPIPTPPLPGG
ncbi:MAG TPA: hypothetical protein VL728_20315 [Cyclobacteriaceae bacterium]|jgi:hypothetical protein|nr:hypothetical protein [Cyclobacteriaceae bacterium]